MVSYQGSGILSLLDEKNLAPDKKRRIIATSAALELISVAVAPQNATHKLSEEMQLLSKYVEAIEAALSGSGS